MGQKLSDTITGKNWGTNPISLAVKGAKAVEFRPTEVHLKEDGAKRLQLTPHQLEKRKAGLCVEPFCKKHRWRTNSFCHTHMKRRFATMNPVKYLFMVRRNNAKRRGKEWLLTFRQFAKLIEPSSYLELRGRTALSLSIDRKNNNKGYMKGNVQFITVSANARKGARLEYTDYYQKQMTGT